MSEIIHIAIIGAYFFSLLWLTFFSIGQLSLAWHYLKAKKHVRKTITWNVLPKVTIQLPVYNEKYVIGRLIDACAHIDYPKELLTIQVLDDSTDETSLLIQEKINELRSIGVSMQHIPRTDRTGFKAGALAYGLTQTEDEFIAIFDADFIPPSDFLNKTLPHFYHDKIGMVQTRWSHINEKYSFLTRMQAFGLNAHFSVEQVGRQHAGSFINFNGTGGIWRKSCIEESGGWQHDTLTEDLDLSYRAQLQGWQLEYVEEIVCPAELPVMVPAIKSQQYRWNKGAAESARKHLGAILTSSLSWSIKLRAVLHLLGSSVFFFLLTAAILSIPMLYIKEHNPELALWFDLGTAFVIGFVAIGIFYWVSSAGISESKPERHYYIRHFPLFMAFSMGMALHNSVAIIEGFLGKKTPFIRTPKFNVVNQTDDWQANTYVRSIKSVSFSTWMEVLLTVYFLFGMGYGILIGDFGLLLWHLMLCLGFGTVSFLSFKSGYHAAT